MRYGVIVDIGLYHLVTFYDYRRKDKTFFKKRHVFETFFVFLHRKEAKTDSMSMRVNSGKRKEK
jgi:hypothetical protein